MLLCETGFGIICIGSQLISKFMSIIRAVDNPVIDISLTLIHNNEGYKLSASHDSHFTKYP